MEEGSLGCAEVLALVTDYLDAALPPGRHRTVAAHLGACEGCSAWLAQVLATIAAVGCLRDGVISAQVLAALRESFGERCRGGGVTSDGGGARGRRT
ncbi:zf-HC2 domain-containing protein [Nonomuraea rubra]|uniref:zf-HC2 domain-containing protein n=1 Tax=Nonomuraea rubra TaxID=46180 RepID=UPI0033E9CC8F